MLSAGEEKNKNMMMMVMMVVRYPQRMKKIKRMVDGLTAESPLLHVLPSSSPSFDLQKYFFFFKFNENFNDELKKNNKKINFETPLLQFHN